MHFDTDEEGVDLMHSVEFEYQAIYWTKCSATYRCVRCDKTLTFFTAANYSMENGRNRLHSSYWFPECCSLALLSFRSESCSLGRMRKALS